MEPGAAGHKPLVGAFGEEIVDGEGQIDRAHLGAIVFADAEQRARLNAILHPLVREAEEELRRAADPDDVFVTDGALLVEAGFQLRFDRLVVVHCQPAVQLARLRQRDGIDEDSAKRRIAAQMENGDKLRFAHFQLDTSGLLADTDRAANALADQLLDLALAPRGRVALPWRRTAGLLVHGPSEGPGGLRTIDLLAEVLATGAAELPQLASRLRADRRAWYQPATDQGHPGPETLAGPTALWAVAQSGVDLEFVAGACYTVARVTHTAPSQLANACLFGLGLAAVAEGELDEKRLEALTVLAGRWGRAEPEPSVTAALTAAARSPGEREAVRVLAGQLGGDPILAAGLAGFMAGGADFTPEVERVARLLEAYGKRDLSG